MVEERSTVLLGDMVDEVGFPTVVEMCSTMVEERVNERKVT